MELTEIIEKRRAYRSLGPVAIDEGLVRELAMAASLSASCFNHQPWRFVFAYDADVLGRLQKAMNKGNGWTQAASLIIAVCSRKDLDCVSGEREYYLFDTGMASAFLILKATAMGLVAHPIAGFDEALAKDALAIPADMRLITLIIVGRHLQPSSPLLSPKQAEAEKERPQRVPLGEIMKLNHY